MCVLSRFFSVFVFLCWGVIASSGYFRARTLRETRRRRAEESVVDYSLQRGNATESDTSRSDMDGKSSVVPQRYSSERRRPFVCVSAREGKSRRRSFALSFGGELGVPYRSALR